MSHFDQEGMIVLYRFPRGLHCKTLVDLLFSKTSKEDLDYEFSLLYFYFLSFLLTSNIAFLFSMIMAKFDYLFIKKTQAKTAKRAKATNAQAGKAKEEQHDHVEDEWVPFPPPISLGAAKRVNPVP